MDHITDIHAERKVCTLCPETFINFNIHMSPIHKTHGSNNMCCICGKEMSSKQSLTNHEEICIGNLIGKVNKNQKTLAYVVT